MIRFAETFADQKIVSMLSAHLGWSHFVEIVPLDNELKRDFYAEMCRTERWSVRTLRAKIDGMLFERTALSSKPRKLIQQEINNLRKEDRLVPDEVRQINFLSQIVAEFGEPDAEIEALRITEEEDAWTRFAFKLATGSGKTKVMSLAIAWNYFHTLRESDSPMARHFVVTAPNLTVHERLKEDFGDRRIFDADPLIPSEWRGDWNMSVVLQVEASGAVTGGVIYLANIHRLYDVSKRNGRNDAETYSLMGPAVSTSTTLGEVIGIDTVDHKPWSPSGDACLPQITQKGRTVHEEDI